MEITIMDWNNHSTTVDIGYFDTIKEIWVHVVTGDEILEVTYNNGDVKKFDSSIDRIMNFYDFSYPLYENGNWTEEWQKFLVRRTSYDI